MRARPSTLDARLPLVVATLASSGCGAVDQDALARAAYAILATFVVLLVAYVGTLVVGVIVATALLVRALRRRASRPASLAALTAGATFAAWVMPPALTRFPVEPFFVERFGHAVPLAWYAPAALPLALLVASLLVTLRVSLEAR